MVSWNPIKRAAPIGVDVGTRSIKLMQFSPDRRGIVDFARWEFPPLAVGDPGERLRLLSKALVQLREGRHFRGKEAVLCLHADQLFVQNIRVPKAPADELDELVYTEIEPRLPFPLEESELRYVVSADVRQGDAIKREVIVMACHVPVLEQTLDAVIAGGLRPVAVDVEPWAVLRAYANQYRRDEDQGQRAMYVHMGSANTSVVIAQDADVLFVKYLELGGQHMDEAVARSLELPMSDAVGLRRHNGDRRAEQQDPEIARGVGAAVRPVLDRLCNELAMCVRYHSVTIRGKALSRVILTGGEATTTMAETLSRRLDMKCELGDPLRSYERGPALHHRSQWDVVAGLALREVAPPEHV